MDRTYRVVRHRTNCQRRILAEGIETMAEAAEIALRLLNLQECDLGGDAEFTAEAE